MIHYCTKKELPAKIKYARHHLNITIYAKSKKQETGNKSDIMNLHEKGNLDNKTIQ